MLTPPEIDDRMLLARVDEEYGLRASALAFLPLGADMDSAVYRMEAAGTSFFLKLRKGSFDEINVSVPLFLHAQGIGAIIAPLETRARRAWASLDPFKMVLYPFVDGVDGYTAALADAQWLEFGRALRGIHDARLPADLARRIPREDYSPFCREQVAGFQTLVERETFADPSAAKFAAILREQRAVVSHALARANALAARLGGEDGQDFVLCHADIHAGNLLLTPAGGLYIVDWDNPTYAPKERDLQLIGGCATWNDPREIALFYEGYGPAALDPLALAYYRYERAIQDISAFGEQLLLSDAGGDDREQSLGYFAGIFLPNHEIDLAARVDPG